MAKHRKVKNILNINKRKIEEIVEKSSKIFDQPENGVVETNSVTEIVDVEKPQTIKDPTEITETVETPSTQEETENEVQEEVVQKKVVDINKLSKADYRFYLRTGRLPNK